MLKRQGRLLVLGLAVSGLVLSLLLNLWLIRQSRIWERTYYLTRLDPLGTSAYPTTSLPATGPRVVFYGDSRIAQWPLPSAPPGVEYFNRGIDGQSTHQALLRYDDHVVPLQPTVLVVQLGVNDLISIKLLERQRDEIVAETKARLAALVERARADGITVVLTTIFPAAAPDLPTWLVPPPASVAAVAEVNAFLQSLASERVIIVDTAAILADERGLVRPEYRADMWHLNRAGYSALNTALTDLLVSLTPTK